MKKWFIILLILLSILWIKLISSYLLNEKVIKDYNQGIYQKNILKLLKIANINEPYIVYYNEGNIFYREQKYDNAINNYEIALEKNPPLKEKCMIRINIAMALIQEIDEENKTEKLALLEQAKKNLYEDHCADEKDSSGKSSEAEELEEQIKIEQQKTEKEAKENNKDNQGQEKEEEEIETEEEKSMQKELQEINKEANANRQRDLQELENLGKYHYYSGKNW